jgi:hypothetical protein
VHPREATENVLQVFGGYSGAIVKAWIAAGWREGSGTDPTVEIHQGSAQQRAVIDPIKRLLAATAVAGIGIPQG